MWDRKNQPNPTPNPNPAAAPTPVVRVPAAVADPVKRGTSIGPSISIVGEIYSEEDLIIDGEVQGALEVKDCILTIGPGGKATSNVKAREVIILGEVKGDIDATQKITIRKQGSLVGNIKTMGIVIDDEAYFKGSIDIVRKPAETAS